MKSLKSILCFLIAPWFFTSCGTGYKGAAESSPHAVVVNDYPEESENHIEYYQVRSIDNRSVDYKWEAGRKKRLLLSPGSHDIVIKGGFQRSFAANRYAALGNLTLNAQPGRRYRAKGLIEGSKIKMWIEDESTGKPASSITSVNYDTEEVPTPVIIPVPVG